MIDESDLFLPLALLQRVHKALSDANGPDALQATYPLLVDMLWMAVDEIDRLVDGRELNEGD